MVRRLIVGVVSCLAVLLAAGTACAQFTLGLNVPLYGQDTSYYCGAASAQMMMMGYPNPADRACFGQTHIYNRIQAHKQNNAYYTDADGLRDTVMELNPPPLGHYSIFHNTDRDIVMHDNLYWMASREYPTATLIWGGAHWVVISGFQTDVDPRAGNAVLQSIDINDPAPMDYPPRDDPCTVPDEGNEGGTFRQMTGTAWYANDWANPTDAAGKWQDEYIAIVEPPAVAGRITVREPEAFCGDVIPAGTAVELATRYVREMNLFRREPFAFLLKTRPKTAFLVNREFKGYYLVPFQSKDGLCPGAIILNAYTGAFQEVGAFARPLPYISEEEAIGIAACSARRGTPGPGAAELVFEYSEQTRSRYRPVWRVMVAAEREHPVLVRYVDQLGQVFVALTRPPLWGD